MLQNGQLQRPLNGVPMVASSPVRHEGPPGLPTNPVEVQSYQTPWKALSEFALQGDMDHQHPPFQQLVSKRHNIFLIHSKIHLKGSTDFPLRLIGGVLVSFLIPIGFCNSVKIVLLLCSNFLQNRPIMKLNYLFQNDST